MPASHALAVADLRCPPLHPDGVAELNASLGAPVPEDYAAFLMLSNGARWTFFNDDQETGVELYSTLTPAAPGELEYVDRTMLFKSRRAGFFPIGRDLASDEDIGYVVFELLSQPQNAAIFLREHETDRVEKWSPNLTQLLEQLRSADRRGVFTPQP